MTSQGPVSRALIKTISRYRIFATFSEICRQMKLSFDISYLFITFPLKIKAITKANTFLASKLHCSLVNFRLFLLRHISSFILKICE